MSGPASMRDRRVSIAEFRSTVSGLSRRIYRPRVRRYAWLLAAPKPTFDWFTISCTLGYSRRIISTLSSEELLSTTKSSHSVRSSFTWAWMERRHSRRRPQTFQFTMTMLSDGVKHENKEQEIQVLDIAEITVRANGL